jgi:HKD family nuclease
MNGFTDFVLGCQTYEKGTKSLLSLITEEIASNEYTRISACAAYASYRGVVLVRTAIASAGIPKFRWLLGLDDCITDPQAIYVASGMKNAETRLVAITSGRRFHAKAYLLDLSAKQAATLIIGSANLTERAFTKNCESFVLVRAKTQAQIIELQQYWDLLWRMGEPATRESVSRYEKQCKERRLNYSEVEEESSSAAPTSRTTRLVKRSLDTSKLAWIMLGYNTGGGSQLDIVKRLASFLGLPKSPIQGSTAYLTFNSPLGSKTFQLTFTKGMWRFMNLQQGFKQRLRPNPEKASPYVLVISPGETDTSPTLTIQRLNSQETENMIDESKQKGFVDWSKPGSSGRRFGWY